jgi:cell division transport system permease protein
MAALYATSNGEAMAMKLRTGEYFIQEVFRSLRRNNWMSFASIGTVAVSLFVLGVFLILVLNMNRMASTLESQVQISVYLEEDLSRQQRIDLQSNIEKMQGIDTVKFVDKDEAKARLSERLGDQKYLLEALGDKNPLPDAFELTVAQPDMVETAAKAIERMDGVESAKYGQDVVEHLFDITRLMRIFGLVLMLLLAGATIFIISNTIRLTVFARRKEIAIMKYVGATDWFIRWPFLMEGIVLGCIGGILSAIALRSFYAAMAAKIYSTLAFFPLMPQYPFMNYVTVGIILAGMAIGAGGSAISLKRFLKV